MGVFKSIKSFFLEKKDSKTPSKEKKEENIDKLESDEAIKAPKIKNKLKTPSEKVLKDLPIEEPKPKTKLESKEDPKSSLDKGLEKTKKSFFSKLSNLFVGRSKVDIDVLDELEEILIRSDVGVDTTIKIIDNIETRVSEEKYVGKSELNKILKEEISKILEDANLNINLKPSIDTKPYVIMVVGVNGVGKTTTIGKLAYAYKNKGKKVILGASDTFRAAAIDQLQVWADRVGVNLVKQQMGSDPASVAYDTLKSAKSQQFDVVIIDTAGRLHNKVNLMNELSKIKRVMDKIIPDSPHEVILVLDGSTGQNAFEQAKQFSSATDVSSLAITKLDGTAKGGVVLGISHQLKIPVKYIGIGEKITDLKFFDPKTFVESFFK
jgi:fused signal recognition particle receptor